jgi:DNA-binding PadR family transcriptional regulator
MKSDSQLGLALLGLIRHHPMSGYDLRKVFTSTAMGTFSNSPGAIYPALARLEASGLACSTIESSTSMRKRRIFEITADGIAALKAWMQKPVTRDDVVRNAADLMLRFAFMEGVLDSEAQSRFLAEFAEQVRNYLLELETFLHAHGRGMPLSSRLALECGIQEYATRLNWARTSAALYEAGKRNLV